MKHSPHFRNFISLLLLVCVILALFPSCGDVAKDHARRIGETFSSIEAGSTIETMQLDEPELAEALVAEFLASAKFRDLDREVTDQRQGGAKIGKKISYAVTVLFPDFSGIPYETVLTDYPAIEWGTVTRASYSTELRQAYYDAMIYYMQNLKYPMRAEELIFRFERVDRNWVVTPDADAVKTICRSFLSDVEGRFQKYRAGGDYLSVVAAERVNKAIAAASDFPVIFSNTHVVKMEGFSNGSYRVTLDTVDYTELFSAVSEEVYKDYKEQNPDGVYAPPADAILEAMLKAGMEESEHALTYTQIELDSDSGDPEDIRKLITDVISSQLEVEIDDLSERIRSNMIRESVSEPRTQVVRGTSDPKNGMPFKIYTPSKYDSHYIKINNASTGETFISVYIREGDSITVYLPVGQYRIRYATGSKWYGWDELFGPDGDYLTFKETISIKKDNKYSLTLYQQADSNMTTKSLTQESF